MWTWLLPPWGQSPLAGQRMGVCWGFSWYQRGAGKPKLPAGPTGRIAACPLPFYPNLALLSLLMMETAPETHPGPEPPDLLSLC